MSVLEASILWLAPPECISCGKEGHTLCKSCSLKIIPYSERCWNCASLSPKGRTCPRCRRPGSPAHVWIAANHEGLARELLHTYKFDHQRIVAESLAQMMAKNFIDNNGSESSNYLVVSVPTATSRVRERGFDHSGLLARNIARKLGLERQSVLGRLGQTRQVGAIRANRQAQITGKFWVKKPAGVVGRQILLIDDVVTTGATLYEASKTLQLAGATRVDALIFAKHL